MKDLINRLLDTASKGISVCGDLQMEAADAIEALQAENESLKARWKQFEKYDCDEIKVAYALADELRKERDALKADAERYRVIRSASTMYSVDREIETGIGMMTEALRFEELDAAIDAARSK